MEGEQVLRHWDLLRVVAASVCRRHTVERTDPPWIDIFSWRARLRLRTARLDDLFMRASSAISLRLISAPMIGLSIRHHALKRSVPFCGTRVPPPCTGVR